MHEIFSSNNEIIMNRIKQQNRLGNRLDIYYSSLDPMNIIITKNNEFDMIKYQLYQKWVENGKLRGIFTVVDKLVSPYETKIIKYVEIHVGDK